MHEMHFKLFNIDFTVLGELNNVPQYKILSGLFHKECFILKELPLFVASVQFSNYKNSEHKCSPLVIMCLYHILHMVSWHGHPFILLLLAKDVQKIAGS